MKLTVNIETAKTTATNPMNIANVWFHFGEWQYFKNIKIGVIVLLNRVAPPPVDDVIVDTLGNIMISRAHAPSKDVRRKTRDQQNPEMNKYISRNDSF